MTDDQSRGLQGAGLGLRRALMGPLLSLEESAVDFLERAPENWIGVGGRYGAGLEAVGERFPLVLHGLSLDIGGPDPLDARLLDGIAQLMDRFAISPHSEHLSHCAMDGHQFGVPSSAQSLR